MIELLKNIYLLNIDEKVQRWTEIPFPKIIGNHYFSRASYECYCAYRDGYFILSIMGVHSVNEGIISFIDDVNNCKLSGQAKEIKLERYLQAGIITEEFYDKSIKIINLYRNDYHHMNKVIEKLNHTSNANTILTYLSKIEDEIFGGVIVDGKFKPNQPKYYNINGQYASVFLRSM